MPRGASRCWFFTAVVHWSHCASDKLGEEFLKLIHASIPWPCARLDAIAFSYDERVFHDRQVSPERILSGIIHSTQQIRRNSVEAWIQDPLLVMSWQPQETGKDFRTDPQFQKFLAESDVDGCAANLRRRINVVGDCSIPPKKMGRPKKSPCLYKNPLTYLNRLTSTMTSDEMVDDGSREGQIVVARMPSLELFAL